MWGYGICRYSLIFVLSLSLLLKKKKKVCVSNLHFVPVTATCHNSFTKPCRLLAVILRPLEQRFLTKVCVTFRPGVARSNCKGGGDVQNGGNCTERSSS